MGNDLDSVGKSLNDTFKFLTKNYKMEFTEFVKIYLLMYVVAILGILIIGGAAFLILGSMIVLPNTPWILAIIGLVALLIVLIFVILTTSISSTAYTVIDKKELDIFGKIKEILVPVAKYFIGMGLLKIAVFGIPAIIVLFGFLNNQQLMLWLGVLLFILCILVWIVIGFFIQFALVEIVIRKKDGIEAIKDSYRLVKKNIVATVVFDILLMVAMFAINAVFGAIQNLVGVVFIFGIFNIAFMVLGGIFMIVIMFFQSIIMGMIMIPAQYFFWKAIGGSNKK
ncbi:hypothetical protein KKB44_05170 [Candidatus Micrarchaeota archaeon]|nr:hypothetical protein [Candidatus Micrarchaeota archaeon]